MNDYIFTFGVGRPYRDHYVRITAEDEMQARHMMFMAHGNKWAFSYPISEAEKVMAGHKELAHFTPFDVGIDWEFRS